MKVSTSSIIIIISFHLFGMMKHALAVCTIDGVATSNTTIMCDSDRKCINKKIIGCQNVVCSGTSSCWQSEIEAVTITCSGISACSVAPINSGTVTCTAKDSCWNAFFGGTVEVKCVAPYSCELFEFKGKAITCKSGACYQVTQADGTCRICETDNSCFFDYLTALPAGKYGSCATPTPAPTPAPPTPAPKPVCFSGETTVLVPSGKVAMKDLKIGDKVLTKSGTYQPIFAWAQVHPETPTTFLQINVKSGQSPVEVTEDHNIYVEGKAGPIRAGLINPGDILVGNGSPNQRQVVKISHVKRQGVFAPLTQDGTVVVGDGVLASCYISVLGDTSEYLEVAGITLPVIQDMVNHGFTSPLRVLCLGVSSKICDWHNERGLHFWFVFVEEVAHMIDDYSLVHMLQLVVYLPIVICAVPFMAIELAFGPVHGPFLVLVGIGVVVANPWITRKLASWVGACANQRNKSM